MSTKVFAWINLKVLLRILPQHRLNRLNLLAFVGQAHIASQRFPTVSTLSKTTYSVFQHKQNSGEATVWASWNVAASRKKQWQQKISVWMMKMKDLTVKQMIAGGRMMMRRCWRLLLIYDWKLACVFKIINTNLTQTIGNFYFFIPN